MFFRRVHRKSWQEKVLERVFKDRKLCEGKLLPFGCVCGEHGFLYRATLMNGMVRMEFEIHMDGSVNVAVRDADGSEMPFSTQGTPSTWQERAFRREYEEELWHVAECCFEPDAFRNETTRRIVAHIGETYGDEPEFLWRRSPRNAVVRRRDKGKWYAALLAVPRLKLGGNSSERVEILNLRVFPGDPERLADNRSRFPAYHMNKKNWISLCLDGSVPFEELASRLETSYRLAGK